MALLDRSQQLKKQLALKDVYAIATGAMFSTGFFLLPGLAFAKTGPSVILAYLGAALLALPGMFSKAELCTAMPRAGGTYYFLDRSLGPLSGTIGGLAAWLVMVLKSAFSLIGIGAYLVLLLDLEVKPVALALTVFFTVLNIVGAKETGKLQAILVGLILAFATFFLVDGLLVVESSAFAGMSEGFFSHGWEGFAGTMGFVFVSYAGLTKVASVAEEVERPERNLPLGMMLSLGSTTLLYVGGLALMIALVPAETLAGDVTPVATAAAALTNLPAGLGVLLAVIAAVAAFASTGNAGILSGSRYPLAMARDRLIPDGFAKLSPSGMPVRGILVTSALMAFCIIALDVEKIAKLASSVQLLIFAFINLAVIVMREARIESYDAGYRSPLYPWMQIFGIVGPMWLITQMGLMAKLFSLALVLACALWYRSYARYRVDRHGALYHVFARLGQKRFEGLDRELRSIMKEKGLRSSDPFDELVAKSQMVLECNVSSFDEVAHLAAIALAPALNETPAEVFEHFVEGTRVGATPVSHGAALPHLRSAALTEAMMVVVRCREGVTIDADELPPGFDDPGSIHALFFVASPEDDPSLHLRILAQIAGRVDDDGFIEEWLAAGDESALKEVLLRDERFWSVVIGTGRTTRLIGKALRDLDLPRGCLVALIRRDGNTHIPDGKTLLHGGDRLTVIGDPTGLAELHRRWS